MRGAQERASPWDRYRCRPDESSDVYVRRLLVAAKGSLPWSHQHRATLATLAERLPALSHTAGTLLLLQTLAYDLPLTEIHGRATWEGAGRWLRPDARALLVLMNVDPLRLTVAYERSHTWRMPHLVPEENLLSAVYARLHATGWWPTYAAQDQWLRTSLRHEAPYDVHELRDTLYVIAGIPYRNRASSEELLDNKFDQPRKGSPS